MLQNFLFCNVRNITYYDFTMFYEAWVKRKNTERKSTKYLCSNFVKHLFPFSTKEKYRIVLLTFKDTFSICSTLTCPRSRKTISLFSSRTIDRFRRNENQQRKHFRRPYHDKFITSRGQGCARVCV